ncbi:MAG: DHA2 family efflux MFS transporter permease subunit [Alphaproteobacteria bacterium]|nr:DHA2 family efflux MFS transporter permease subunit [Alphaproteobacteria bacterium]
MLVPRLERSAIIALTVATALFMENLDGTVIATALPQIAASFAVNPVRLSLAITSYLLSVAIFIPASGWMADRFGARTVFRAAIAVFTLGSVLCGLSGDLLQLTGARIIQGVGGAMMVPIGRLVLLRSVTKSEMVQAMSYLTVPALIGPVLGPPVGGFIVTYASWRWIFFLNVPIGVLGLVLVSILIENYKEEKCPPLDISGFLLSGLALAGLMLGFETAGREGVPLSAVAMLLAVGAIALVLYIRHAGRHPHPILDLLLFRIPSFAISVGAGTLFRIGVGALPFLLPLTFQIGFGMSAFTSGLLTFMSAVGALAMKITARPILRRFGFRTCLVGNALISAAFMLTYAAFRPGTPNSIILVLLLIGGFSRSLQFTGLNTLAYADVPPNRMSRATSLSSTAQQLSQSIGVATGAVLLHLTLFWRGSETLSSADFWPSFVVVSVMVAWSSWFFTKLPEDAGAEVSGHLYVKPPPS